MVEEIAKYGGGAAASFLTPFGMIALIVAVILIFLLPRNRILIVILCFLILIPQGQQFYFGGVHLYFYRIIVLVGLVKVFNARGSGKGKILEGRWNSIDTAFLLYVLIRAIAYSLRYRTLGAVINQIALILDTFGVYFLLRSLLKEDEDIDRILVCLCYILTILAIEMLIEQTYKVNLFGYIGGSTALEIRNGSIRSYGPFRHALTAGNTAGAVLPAFFFLWFRNKHKGIAVLGIVAATIMVITVHSSGPLIAIAAGIMALFFWPFRASMRKFRWAAALLLIALDIVMKAPVWFIVARINLTGSSSSYQRANLIDKFIRNFWDWWLIGSSDYGTWGWFLWDVQNQYVSVGLNGGLGALISYIAIIVYSFSIIGKARKCADNEQKEKSLWALGASMFSYTVAFLGVNLFDQSQFIWFLLLAIISTYTFNMSKSEDTSVLLNRK